MPRLPGGGALLGRGAGAGAGVLHVGQLLQALLFQSGQLAGRFALSLDLLQLAQALLAFDFLLALQVLGQIHLLLAAALFLLLQRQLVGLLLRKSRDAFLIDRIGAILRRLRRHLHGNVAGLRLRFGNRLGRRRLRRFGSLHRLRRRLDRRLGATDVGLRNFQRRPDRLAGRGVVPLRQCPERTEPDHDDQGQVEHHRQRKRPYLVGKGLHPAQRASVGGLLIKPTCSTPACCSSTIAA